MTAPDQRIYLFDDFCLDVNQCELRRQGEIISLPPKVFDVLRVMVENRGRILAKEFLLRELWPDTFVEDGTLPQYIFLLRKALQEEASEHRYIETVPRRGYRFIAAIQELSSEEYHRQQNGSAAFTNELSRQNYSVWTKFSSPPIVWLFSILLVGVAATVIYWLTKNPAKNLPLARNMQIAKLTTSGKAALPVISPDGRYVAFVVDQAGKQSIWVRQLAAANEVQISTPAEQDFMGLTFAPDSNDLYYLVYGRPQIFGTLFRLPVLGGSATKLIEDIDSPVAFAPDGKRLAFVRLEPLEHKSHLVIADVKGGAQQIVATRKAPDYFHADNGVAWSPDGKTLACAAGSTGANGPFMSLISVSISDGKETPLTTKPWKFVGKAAWRKDGSGLIAIARNQESPLSATQLWSFPFPGGEPSHITNDLNAYASLSTNSAGNKLVTQQSTRVSSFWIAANADAEHAVQLNSATMDNYAHRLGLTWTPQGKLIYGSYASGNADLWQMNLDGSKTQQLTVDPQVDFAPALARDGKNIAFVSNRGGGYGIWLMDANGQTSRQLTTGQADFSPAFTPDGKWIFYASFAREIPTIWKIAVAGGEAAQWLENPAYNPTVSPDGKLLALYYAVPQEFVFKLAVVPVTGGAPLRIFAFVPQDDANIRWSPNGQMITYVATKNGVSNIWGQPLDGSPVKQITNFKSDHIFRFAWSPDGKALVCERGFFVNDVVLLSDFLPS